MNNSIITKKAQRKTLPENWGQIAELIQEENYSIKEFTINPIETIKTDLEKGKAYFIAVSGCAEFEFNGKIEKIFKGEKIEFFCKDNNTSTIKIKNSGVIPLILVRIDL